ncbi:MAG TPA: hypothetical protein VND64_27870 [Pirellulales bacterium]|nr:hypothetical protein [Pirellulales bacterium]
MPRAQFRLRSLFILTAIVAVGCWAGPPIWAKNSAIEILFVGVLVAALTATRWPFNWNDRRIR